MNSGEWPAEAPDFSHFYNPATPPFDWRDYAACGREYDERMFPDAAGGPRKYLNTSEVQVIAEFCAKCPVVRSCLDDAILTGENKAIRGGMTPQGLEAVARIRMESGAIPVEDFLNTLSSHLIRIARTPDASSVRIPMEPFGIQERSRGHKGEQQSVKDRIVEILDSLPEQTYHSPHGSVAPHIAEVLGVNRNAVNQAIIDLEKLGRLTRINARQHGNKAPAIVGITLVDPLENS